MKFTFEEEGVVDRLLECLHALGLISDSELNYAIEGTEDLKYEWYAWEAREEEKQRRMRIYEDGTENEATADRFALVLSRLNLLDSDDLNVLFRHTHSLNVGEWANE